MKLSNLSNKFKSSTYVATITAISSMLPTTVYASNVQGRINNAMSQIQNVLTGLIVTVGIVVALFILIKRMPSADDQQEKNEVYKAVGRVLGLVAIGAAIVWVVPWVYGLFQ